MLDCAREIPLETPPLDRSSRRGFLLPVNWAEKKAARRSLGYLVGGLVPVTTGAFHLGAFLQQSACGLGDFDAVVEVSTERGERTCDERAEGL